MTILATKGGNPGQGRKCETRMSNKVSFHGVKISETERDALLDLENQAGKELSFLQSGETVVREYPERMHPTFAFKVENNHVVRLYLENNQISVLPESIGNLRFLQELYLGDNQINALPDTIGNLASIRILDLDKNCLTRLPETIGNLTLLQGLSANDNSQKSIPDSIGELSALLVLRIQFNILETIPECLGNLPSLRKLLLGGNNISTIPETIGNLSSLEILDLAWNNLIHVPETVQHLPKLHFLALDGNKIVPIILENKAQEIKVENDVSRGGTRNRFLSQRLKEKALELMTLYLQEREIATVEELSKLLREQSWAIKQIHDGCQVMACVYLIDAYLRFRGPDAVLAFNNEYGMLYDGKPIDSMLVERSIAPSRDEIDVLLDHAISYDDQGDIEKTIASYEAALHLDPGIACAWRFAASDLLMTPRRAESAAYDAIAWACNALNKKDHATASKIFQDVLEDAPYIIEAWPELINLFNDHDMPSKSFDNINRYSPQTRYFHGVRLEKQERDVMVELELQFRYNIEAYHIETYVPDLYFRDLSEFDWDDIAFSAENGHVQTLWITPGLYNEYLWGEPLDHLPDSIGELRHLNNLILANNLLDKLPETLGNLTALELLDISYNQLTSLPESIVNGGFPTVYLPFS